MFTASVLGVEQSTTSDGAVAACIEITTLAQLGVRRWEIRQRAALEEAG